MKARLLLLLVLTAMVSGCADYVSFNEAANVEPVGFWYGLWHGIIIPYSWLCSLFDAHVAIYAIYNDGGWYNAGFALGSVGVVSSITQLFKLVGRFRTVMKIF